MLYRFIPLLMVALAIVMMSRIVQAETDQGLLEVRLRPGLDSVVRGAATITANDDRSAQLIVSLEGLASESGYRVLLHAGTCDTPSASAAHVATLFPDQDGRARVETSQAEAAGGSFELNPDLLADGDHLLRVVEVASGSTVACGAIPVVAHPIGTGATSSSPR